MCSYFVLMSEIVIVMCYTQTLKTALLNSWTHRAAPEGPQGISFIPYRTEEAKNINEIKYLFNERISFSLVFHITWKPHSQISANHLFKQYYAVDLGLNPPVLSMISIIKTAPHRTDKRIYETSLTILTILNTLLWAFSSTFVNLI